MQPNNSRKIEKILSAFDKMGKFPKAIIKYGTQFFLALFATGTFLVVLNHRVYNFDPYIEFVAISIIKTSFTILAEVIIGGLVIDYVFNK